ncbi:MAG: DoxX family protein [Candidatus Lambdaproteobacteria bacterium]|nr:DoxX family protein [Candidatus Lambdaproteobacteria bacterium]
MGGWMSWLGRQQATALLLMRLAVGSILFEAGYAVVFDTGMESAVTAFRGWGFPLPQVVGPASALFELLGGLALSVGLFTRYLAVLITIQFSVALLVVKLDQVFPAGRIDAMLIVAGLLLATRGGGLLQLDRALARGRW